MHTQPFISIVKLFRKQQQQQTSAIKQTQREENKKSERNDVNTQIWIGKRVKLKIVAKEKVFRLTHGEREERVEELNKQIQSEAKNEEKKAFVRFAKKSRTGNHSTIIRAVQIHSLFRKT